MFYPQNIQDEAIILEEDFGHAGPRLSVTYVTESGVCDKLLTIYSVSERRDIERHV